MAEELDALESHSVKIDVLLGDVPQNGSWEVLLSRIVCVRKPGLRKKSHLHVWKMVERSVPSGFYHLADASDLRAVLRLAAGMSWGTGTIDVNNSFLNALLPEDRHVVVRPPSVLVKLGLAWFPKTWSGSLLVPCTV